jgi:hypothetical protein
MTSPEARLARLRCVSAESKDHLPGWSDNRRSVVGEGAYAR